MNHAERPVDVTFRRDMTLGGRYRLTDRIAGGGMGEVWAATDQVLRRSVAIKLLRPELLDEPGFLDRFRAEARHTAALAHPGIAGIFDYGEDHRVAYLVMELVNGEPLSAVLARDGALPVAKVLSILAQTSAALDVAHRAGVVHRDVKPGNLLVSPDGVVKITDFGISKVIDSVPLTATGQVLGTPQYISPEQATGSSATAASDLYSLGVIGYEMLVGRRPFTGDTPLALAMAHVHQPPPPLPDSVPADLAAAISSMLSKDPGARPSDAAVLAARFQSMRPSESEAEPAPAPPSSARHIPAAPQLTVLHTALGPSASVGPVGRNPATMVAPGALVSPFGNPASADDDVSVVPLLQRQHRRPPATLIAFGLILLVTIVAVVATRGGDDGNLTDVAGATSVAPGSIETSVVESTAVSTTAPPTTVPAPTTTIVTFDPNVYVGLQQDEATALLEALDFEVDDRTEKKSDEDRGVVVDIEIRPGDGTPGRVTLIVSDGKGRGDEDND